MIDKEQDRRKAPADAAILRQRAEEKAGAVDPATLSLSAQTPEAIEQIFHELRVHQIELEMQNEELRTAQAEIEAGRARYFDLYDLAPVGYVTVSEKGLLLEANLTVTTLLGVNRGALIKQSLTRFILKEDQVTYYVHRKMLFETGKPQRFELRLVSPDSSVFWARLDATLAEESAGENVCRVVLSDITERKKAEEALRQQASERAAVDAFTYSVSHDLQAPLRRIEGFSEALLEECSNELSEKARDYLRRITRQIESMQIRTGALLKLSRVVSHSIENEEVNLSNLIRSHLEKLHYAEPARRVETIVAPEMIAIGDDDLLSVILENLLKNAWKFTAGVENARIECGKAEEDGRTIYFVRDNGVGFDQQYSTKLFTPFQKLHSETDYPGIGIGLNIVYRIITRHGGEIWAEGEPGQGACFFFTLP
jgi:PAS domain S-box-containing protein